MPEFEIPALLAEFMERQLPGSSQVRVFYGERPWPFSWFHRAQGLALPPRVYLNRRADGTGTDYSKGIEPASVAQAGLAFGHEPRHVWQDEVRQGRRAPDPLYEQNPFPRNSWLPWPVYWALNRRRLEDDADLFTAVWRENYRRENPLRYLELMP